MDVFSRLIEILNSLGTTTLVVFIMTIAFLSNLFVQAINIFKNRERSQYGLSRLERQIEEVRKLASEKSKTSDPKIENPEMLLDIKSEAVNRLVDQLTPATIRALSMRDIQNTAAKLQDRLLERLSDQVVALSSRANLALTLGMMFSLSGLAILYFTFFVSPPINFVDATASTNWPLILSLYLPRLSLVIIVEAVSFYFLRLYSKTTSELRYVHNELTNAEMCLASFHLSIEHGNKTTQNQILELIGRTERNHILERGQTTVEIEKSKATSQTALSVLEKTVDLLKSKLTQEKKD